MASIRNEIPLQVSAAEAWDAIRDFGAVHRRVAPGFVTDCRLEGDARVVTFANGMVARELLVDCDDKSRRLVYAIVDGRTTHYSASVQVLEDREATSRIIWIIDLLPNEMAGPVRAMAAQGVAAMKQTLGGG
jgi:hypothetical protein